MSYLFEPFILRALLGGIGLALVAGPLGCFVVWQRMAYFGDSLAHSALLGIALGIIVGLQPSFGILLIGMSFAVLLTLLQHQRLLATDTLLGILSHSALALGIVVFSFLPTVRFDLLGYLFGDILTITWRDLVGIYSGAFFMGISLIFLWRPLLITTLHADLAQVEGIAVGQIQLLFMLLLAVMVAIAMQIVGALLMTALLIIPAATARSFARSPHQMAILASIIGMLAVILGLALSLWRDIPSGPAIVVVAMGVFLISALLPKRVPYHG